MRNFEIIKGHEKLIRVFGEWPSFHDAEVISFSINRGHPFKHGFTQAKLCVNIRKLVIEYSDSIHYEYIENNNTLVYFLFHNAIDIKLDGFNHQNVIDDISISDKNEDRSLLLVEIDSIWGFGGSLTCSQVELEQIEQLDCGKN